MLEQGLGHQNTRAALQSTVPHPSAEGGTEGPEQDPGAPGGVRRVSLFFASCFPL